MNNHEKWALANDFLELASLELGSWARPIRVLGIRHRQSGCLQSLAFSLDEFCFSAAGKGYRLSAGGLSAIRKLSGFHGGD